MIKINPFYVHRRVFTRLIHGHHGLKSLANVKNLSTSSGPSEQSDQLEPSDPKPDGITPYGRRKQLSEFRSAVQDVIPVKKVNVRASPKERRVVLFSGEPFIYPGMVEKTLELPQVKQMYDYASERYKVDLIDITLNGPSDRLQNPEWIHLITFLSNAAALEKLKIVEPNIEKITRTTTGLGVGEINALVFSQMITLEEAMDYLHLRGQLIKKLFNVIPELRSSLLVFSGKTRLRFVCRAAKEWCIKQGVPEQDIICEINYSLGPEMCVVSGHKEALKFIFLNFKNFGFVHKYKYFNMPYYTSLMKPISDMLAEALPPFDNRHPRYLVVSAIDGKPYNTLKLRKHLIQQISSPVLIQNAFTTIYKRKAGTDYPITYECSARSALKTYLKRCCRKATDGYRNILAI